MFAAFHIPDLPIAAALPGQPAWRDRPCGILREPTGRDDGKIPLLALNAAARDTGVAPGWQLNRALVRCPDLQVLDRQPQQEARILTELLAFAERFTPDVERTSPDTVLLDLTGTRRASFEGLEALPESGVEIAHALADTPDLAHFAVLEPSTRGRRVTLADIDALPVSLLATMEENGAWVPLLDLLGMRTLGDFRKLPRQGLTERLGAIAGRWHDLVAGKTCRLLKLHRPPESLAQAVDFDDAIHSSEALVFVFNRLLHVLASRLAARHLAASILEIHLRLESGSVRREIHLPEPLSAPSALLKPIQTFAESLVLTAPVIGIELNATAALPLSRQSDWARRQLPNPERWADTLARLEALVGGGRVGIPLPLESDRPDAFVMRNANHLEPVGTLPPVCSVPLQRFRPPLNIAVAFEFLSNKCPRPLALLTGPYHGEVLEQRGPFITSGGPWNPHDAWHRLEWDVRLDRAPLLRLVFQPGGHWQLDGTYC